MDLLPNEIYLIIVKKLRYIDVFSFPLTCKIFHELCRGFADYLKRLRRLKEIIGYNHEALFKYLNETFENLQKYIEEGFGGVFAKRKYVFSIVKIKLRRLNPL